MKHCDRERDAASPNSWLERWEWQTLIPRMFSSPYGQTCRRKRRDCSENELARSWQWRWQLARCSAWPAIPLSIQRR